MNYGKMTVISKSLSGLMFSVGAFLIVVWNVAGNPFINPFQKVFMWAIPGLVLGFIGTWNAIQFVNALNIRQEASDKTEHETNAFQIFHMIKQSDQNITQVIATFLIVCLGIGFNVYVFNEGNWKINNAMTFLFVGWVTPFFFWKFFSSAGELKSFSNVKKTSSKAVPPTKGGAMVVEFNNDVIIFTLQNIVIGKSKHPLPILKVRLSEIRDFRVFDTSEEFEAFKSRNINGDLEFGIKATIAQVTFYTDPTTRPECLSISGSSGDIHIYVSGDGFRWLLAVQPQYHELLTTLDRKVGPIKKVAN